MNYLEEKLLADSIEISYEIAHPRIRQHLQAELDYVSSRLNENDIILELGCGYGRALFQMSPYVHYCVGIDISDERISYANHLKQAYQNCDFFQMDAVKLEFSKNEFDVVICMQNGIGLFNVDHKRLIWEALRVAKERGRVIFTSYSDEFWSEQVEWFQLQTDRGMISDIDPKAGNLNLNNFSKLCESMQLDYTISEIDNTIVFCEICKP